MREPERECSLLTRRWPSGPGGHILPTSVPPTHLHVSIRCIACSMLILSSSRLHLHLLPPLVFFLPPRYKKNLVSLCFFLAEWCCQLLAFGILHSCCFLVNVRISGFRFAACSGRCCLLVCGCWSRGAYLQVYCLLQSHGVGSLFAQFFCQLFLQSLLSSLEQKRFWSGQSLLTSRQRPLLWVSWS